MRAYGELNREELLAMKQEVEASYEEARGKGLKLDMSRGKPSKKQLDLAEGMLTVISSNEDCMAALSAFRKPGDLWEILWECLWIR